ncbi:MAG: phytanoyl-CoA dioxygenase family protein [Chloroflexi bacterium]|nr:phytanoyl-CoA dioxygenase family protein [Chloroflexota bacterium]
MALTTEQKAFFEERGYLPYKRVLSDEELEVLRQRSVDIATGKVNHVPPRFIQHEKAFQNGIPTGVDPLDTVRKMTQLCYFDDAFQAIAKKAEILDAVEELLGSPNIKLYTDQLMMKPRFHGTVTDWHQDSVAWPFFLPQDHVSCWVALDDATIENGCMTVLPGSHKWGPVAREYRNRFLEMPELEKPAPVELKAGACMFHHGLNWHRTGANSTPNRRRGLAMHYITAETKYLGLEDEESRMLTECEKPKGTFRFLLVRGQEFPGRV